MNKADRKALDSLRTRMDAAVSLFEATRDEVAAELRSMAEDQRSRFDNLPEGLQGGAAGEALENAASRLEEVADELDAIEVLVEVDWEVE